MNNEKQHITPAQAVEILEKNGLKISEKDAMKILDFLYKIAILQGNQIIRKKYEKR